MEAAIADQYSGLRKLDSLKGENKVYNPPYA